MEGAIPLAPGHEEMDSANGSTPAAPVRATTVRGWLLWAAIAAVGVPVTIILHELGHLVSASAFGFPDVMLHYGSVSDGAAQGDFPAWQEGVTAAAGPLVTVGIVLGCCYLAVRLGPRPWTVAPAFAAGVRSILIGIAYVIARVRHGSVEGNFDELNAARQLGLSTDLFVGANMLVLAGAWAFLIHRVPHGRRMSTFGAILVGIVAGLALYVGWLGPWMLP